MADPSHAARLSAFSKMALAAALVEHRAALLSLARAARGMTYRRDRHLATGEDPLAGLPDGHGLDIVSVYGEDGEGTGACDLTAGQIRRLRAAIEAAERLLADPGATSLPEIDLAGFETTEVRDNG